MAQFILGLIIGGVCVWFFMRKPKEHSDILENVRMSDRQAGENKAGNLAGFNEGRNDKEEQSKQKILSFVATKNKITNDDVQKLLEVSDATAERYLNELEKSRKLNQVQDQGRGVYYEKP